MRTPGRYSVVVVILGVLLLPASDIRDNDVVTEAHTTRPWRLLAVLLPGAAIAVALGVFGRVHHPTGKVGWVGPFPSIYAMKVWLAVVVLALALVQLLLALWIYGKLGPQAPPWAGRLHRAVGGLAFLVSLPVA